MKRMAVVIGVLLSLLPRSPLPAQEETFSNIYSGLDEAERIASDLQRSNADLRRRLQTLRDNGVLTENELEALKLSNETTRTQYQTLQESSRRMAEDFQALRKSCAEFERRSKFWKWAALVGAPAAALIATGATIMAMK
jgi:chromosome segregation ATPase